MRGGAASNPFEPWHIAQIWTNDDCVGKSTNLILRGWHTAMGLDDEQQTSMAQDITRTTSKRTWANLSNSHHCYLQTRWAPNRAYTLRYSLHDSYHSIRACNLIYRVAEAEVDTIVNCCKPRSGRKCCRKYKQNIKAGGGGILSAPNRNFSKRAVGFGAQDPGSQGPTRESSRYHGWARGVVKVTVWSVCSFHLSLSDIVLTYTISHNLTILCYHIYSRI